MNCVQDTFPTQQTVAMQQLLSSRALTACKFRVVPGNSLAIAAVSLKLKMWTGTSLYLSA